MKNKSDNEYLENTIDHEDINKDINEEFIDNIEEDDKPKSCSNTFFMVLSIALIVTLIYIYTSYEFMTKKELRNKYTKTSEITFAKLPYKIKSLYIREYNCPQNEVVNIPSNNDNIISDLKEKYEGQIEVLNNQIKELQKNNIEATKGLKLRNKIDTLTCKDMPQNDMKMTKKCLKNIDKFLAKNKDASYFEVISLLNKVEDADLKGKLLLSKIRVNEGIIVLREKLHKTKNVFGANYMLKAKDNSKGIVVRAFY